MPIAWPDLSDAAVGGRKSSVRAAAASASIRWRATSATTSAAVSAPGRSSLSCLPSVLAVALISGLVRHSLIAAASAGAPIERSGSEKPTPTRSAERR